MHIKLVAKCKWAPLLQLAKNGWQYVGGEVFNESVISGSKYAELCLKLNEKVPFYSLLLHFRGFLHKNVYTYLGWANNIN
jgi:hypothetical protein